MLFMVLCPGTPEGSTGRKRLRRRGNSLKSHPTDWEKPGIEPATLFCGFPGYKPVPPGWFKVCVGFITGTPKGSPKVVLWRSRESNLRPLVYPLHQCLWSMSPNIIEKYICICRQFQNNKSY